MRQRILEAGALSRVEMRLNWRRRRASGALLARCAAGLSGRLRHGRHGNNFLNQKYYATFSYDLDQKSRPGAELLAKEEKEVITD